MQLASKWRQTKATECRAVQSGSPQTSATKVHTRMKYVVPGWNICFVIKYMVLTPPGKFLKVLVFPLFFKGLDISGNQCRFWKVLEIWRQGPGQFLNLLCFKIDKFELRFHLHLPVKCSPRWSSITHWWPMVTWRGSVAVVITDACFEFVCVQLKNYGMMFTYTFLLMRWYTVVSSAFRTVSYYTKVLGN